MRALRTMATTGLRLLAGLLIVLTTWNGAAPSVSAQSASDVAIFTTENGQPAYDACYVLAGYSDIGCDENGDGRVMFANIPWGTYVVHQTADLGSGRMVNDVTIEVRGNVNSAGYESFSAIIVNTSGSSSSASTVGSSDVAIVTTENGQPVTDACYVLVGYSDVGCDENGDGKITFQDVPLATYTVQQTADLGPGRSVADFSIIVTGAASGDGWERFPATVRTTSSGGSSDSSASNSSGAKDISLITRDPGNGDLLTGTCYILLNHSEEGCDENGDGQVTFSSMPPGTYTIHQTRTPAGYPAVNDFPITVDDMFPDVPVGYLVKQATDQNASGTRNVTFVFVDSRTYTKIVPARVCVKVGSASNVGCDEDLVDGQIDFLDVETGTHPLTFSNLPNGWQIMGDDRTGPSQTIERGAGPQVVYIGVYTGSGNGTGTSSSAGSSGSDGSGEMTAMNISAMTCTTNDPDAIQAGLKNLDGTCYWEIGATFTVATGDGETLGSCTLSGDRFDGGFQIEPLSCTVPVPKGVDLIVTEDMSTVTPGTIPQKNPLTYTYPTDRQLVAAYMGVVFENRPAGGSTTENTLTGTDSERDDGSGSATTGDGTIVGGREAFDLMVGEWYGKRRDVTINADGTGVIDYRQDAFGNELVYAIIINPDTSPVSASIVEVTPYGNIDLNRYPTIGHTVTLELHTYPDGDLLIVGMNHDGWELVVCSVEDADNVQNACY